jgi:translation initiation factor 2B subunit (eIF-2B alpha/beta/delta family)
MRPELQNRIARLAADRESGASEILRETLAILRAGFEVEGELAEVARAVCLAHPSMGSMWNAGNAALAGEAALTRFAQRVSRAPEAVRRFSLELLGKTAGDRALRVVTISYSRTVLDVLVALAGARTLQVACSEARPALEGRTLAVRLAASGVAVTVFGDAAIAHALGEADAVVVGADAVTPDVFLNKSGTRMLAAAAALQGVPCYVVASRDKFVNRETAARLQPREGAGEEIWPESPRNVTVRNPYFEATPLDLVAALVTDAGVVGPASAADVCG